MILKAPKTVIQTVCITTVTTFFVFDLFYKWDRFPLAGGMVRVWSMAKRWHRAEGLGRGQDLVLTKELTTDG